MDEHQGSRRLREVFEAAGYAIAEAQPLVLRAGTVSLDGWDDARRVGYEFVTTEAGDREEFTPAVLAELEAKMRAGELFVFLIDEHDVDDLAALERAARGFLDAVRARGGAR